MFDWIPNLLITFGLSYLWISVFSFVVGFGLCAFIRDMKASRQTTGAAYDGCEEPIPAWVAGLEETLETL